MRQSKSPAMGSHRPCQSATQCRRGAALQMSAFAVYRQPVAEPCRQHHRAGKTLWS